MQSKSTYLSGIKYNFRNSIPRFVLGPKTGHWHGKTVGYALNTHWGKDAKAAVLAKFEEMEAEDLEPYWSNDRAVVSLFTRALMAEENRRKKMYGHG